MRPGARSFTITVRAPKKRAQAVTARPIGPAPITITRSPASSFAAFTACSPTESGSTSAPSWNVDAGGQPQRLGRAREHVLRVRAGYLTETRAAQALYTESRHP